MDKRILQFMNPAELFKQLSDTTRLRSLALMASEGELCVCELTFALGLSQPKISRHLAQLRESGVVESRKEGQWVHYRIHRGLPAWAITVITDFQDGMSESEPFKKDLGALKAMPNRPGSDGCN